VVTAGKVRADAFFAIRYADAITKTKKAARAAWNGNSGIPPPPLVELVLEAEMAVLEEVEKVVDVLEVDALEVLWAVEKVVDALEVLVVTVVGAYWNVVPA
jgi:hypothetical protein